MGFALKNEYLPHYTVAEWERWEGQWELISGVPFAMSPSPAFYHQNINVNIVYNLNHSVGLCEGCKAIMSFDWRISEDTIFQPDVSVTCSPFDPNYLENAPELVFEILSPATQLKDKTIKYDIYEAEGVTYYVIVDPKSKIISIYKLDNGKYILAAEMQEGNFNFTLSKCSFDFDFSKIW